ncbi:hypothetical protein E3U55_02580 [Filobacillus milosensis]|uniref:PucR C-terminal helix-turn-helix domain-containing protein n=1 Tax=Filobacillus milosensis TaxID=94137 RepID=A0A4Y8IRK0_9BACI|nr:helix-turn-helix domain-containing protein [Filobacillus milosensis]TFB24403.1 hypothetical protein E3U55_02580 [Filobacillus milosensis]
MNVEKLMQLFPNIKQVTIEPNDHFTFLMNGQKYAIPFDEVSQDQKNLLDALTDHTPFHTEQENAWQNFLHKQMAQPPQKLEQYRFNVIRIQDGKVNPEEFRQSLQIILNKPITLLWQNNRHVTLLEEIKHNEEPVTFENIIDVMSEDLDVHLRVFVSDIKHHINEAPDYLQWLTSMSHMIWKATGKRIIHQQDSLLELFPSLLSDQDRHYFVESILKETINKSSLLNTIKTVIENQGNITSASKELFMHRNSVQYRVDKFIEETGSDIRQFDQMIRVYLALLLMD